MRENMRDIVLFGVQWSGKGTQGKILAKKYNYAIFETWQELRNIAKTNSPLGKKVKSIIDAGNLVDNNTVMEILRNFLDNTSPQQPILFDGIPREIEQKNTFDQAITQYQRNIIGINIEISRAESLQRLSQRFICQGIDTTDTPLITPEQCIAQGWTVVKRKDDTPEGINKRLDIFYSQTQPVIDLYKEEKKMITIDGIGTIKDIETRISQKLQ